MQSPGVHFPLPLLFMIALAASVWLDRLWPLPVSGALGPTRPMLAWAGIGIGLALLAWAMVTFTRARTALYPNQPATVVVRAGPYRFSRNPMYVAMTILTTGIGVLLDTAWVFVFLPVVLVALTLFIIRREEAYLSSAFEDSYQAYRARVRRWL
jgi:protein-S-isoprenylcysteine O-methyltransferase Ste14